MAKKKKKMEFETMQVKLPHVKGLSIVLPVYLYFMGSSDVLSPASGTEYSFQRFMAVCIRHHIIPVRNNRCVGIGSQEGGR